LGTGVAAILKEHSITTSAVVSSDHSRPSLLFGFVQYHRFWTFTFIIFPCSREKDKRAWSFYEKKKVKRPNERTDLQKCSETCSANVQKSTHCLQVLLNLHAKALNYVCASAIHGQKESLVEFVFRRQQAVNCNQPITSISR
jgi:hypothetical protein